ncbi:ATP-grasp domain-containing protein [Micromonospora narathiwatensis]|uniref:Biotin carboxylase n=1 Tax=Micromonospora narathiwatensis TaxID=299146 RepID=A0A1A8ZAX1_9ACTN|nr:ATP-grasp domain-containing protein [Micromonospora narathiwatensis]SBT41114.1 Biotin carboxylase [Micromonospora narathiwatensis]
MRELLLVGVGLMGRPYLAAARRLGVRVHVVETAAAAAALPDQPDHTTLTSGDSDEAWAEVAAAAVAARKPDGVVAFTEPQVLAAALVADTLSLPGPSLGAAVLSRNKALQRGRFAAAGIRQPEYLIAADLHAAGQWAAGRFPVVLKSLSSAGSVGVELVADEREWADAVRRRAGEAPLLVERAVEGPEYSWEALVHEGSVWFSSITAKETTGPPYFVETGHRTAAPVDAATAASVDDFGRSVLAALGMGSGIVHLEFRLADAGPTLMEVAVRMPGDYLMDLLGLTYGIDWFEMVVRLAMSMPLPERPPQRVAHAAAHFPLAEPGVIAGIDGLDVVRAHPAVERAGVLARVGDVLAPVVSSQQRRAYVLLSADDPAAIDDGLDLARRRFVIRTRPA